MGQKNVKESPEEIQSKTCLKCQKTLDNSNYYKYELVKEAPTCKSCKKLERKKPEKSGKSEKSEKPETTGLYVITTIEHLSNNKFKVGKHTGSQRKLLSRYRTYLIDPIILFYIPSDSIDELEKTILEKVKDHRISDIDGGDTEWVNIDIKELISIILPFI